MDTVLVALDRAERVSEPVCEGVREGQEVRLRAGVFVAAAVVERDTSGDAEAEAQGEEELEECGVLLTPGVKVPATDAEEEWESEGEGELELELLPERVIVGVIDPLPVALAELEDVALPE